MRYLEWILLLVISGLGIGLANFVGFQVGFMDSLPGQSDPTVQPAERLRSNTCRLSERRF